MEIKYVSDIHPYDSIRLGILCCFACGVQGIGGPVSGGVSDLLRVTFREVVEDGPL